MGVGRKQANNFTINYLTNAVKSTLEVVGGTLRRYNGGSDLAGGGLGYKVREAFLKGAVSHSSLRGGVIYYKET